MRDMKGKPIGIILLTAALLTAGLAGIFGFWVAWPRASNISPLAAMFALGWSCTYLVAGVLTWRRSRLAAPALYAAIGLLMLFVSFVWIVPTYLAMSSP